MKRIPQPCEFYLYDVPNHAELKVKILEGIYTTGKHSVMNFVDKISNTDWHQSPSVLRPYFQHLHPVINVHIADLRHTIGLPDYTALDLTNYWFQQYEEGDHHQWHTHPNSTFSNVYYVDLPEGAVKTSFKFAGNEFEVDVKEGQILTFPACFLHCSKPNKKATKTVVAFNYS